jgi:hypothetical protein
MRLIVADIKQDGKSAKTYLADFKNLKELKDEARNAMSPQGVVAFFDKDCPDGWDELKEEAGRFLLAAGAGFPRNHSGGKKEVVPGLAEMPSHEHKTEVARKGFKAVTDTWKGGGTPGGTFVGSQDSIEVKVTASGGGKAHENMPPYLALTLCRKK